MSEMTSWYLNKTVKMVVQHLGVRLSFTQHELHRKWETVELEQIFHDVWAGWFSHKAQAEWALSGQRLLHMDASFSIFHSSTSLSSFSHW